MTPPFNLLWIVTTQWRAQACGYAGDPNAQTPNLDRLASRALHYTQAVTPHPFGPFARAALFTGVPSPENGVRDYYDPLPPHAETVAHTFGRQGYRTAFFGKWHLGPRDRTAPLVGEAHARAVVPLEHRGGFEFWEGFEGGFVLNHPWLHGTRLPEPQQFSGYQSDVVCERAAAWIAAHAGEPEAGREARPSRPWFCCVSLEPPHPPYDQAPGTAHLSPHALALRANVPRGGAVEHQARRELAGYYAHIRETDRAVGDLLDRVDPARTVVVVTSVHGDMHGSHGLFRKGWPHEESVRVPLLVSLPGSTREARADLVTLGDLAGLCSAWVAGRDLRITRSAATLGMPSVVTLPHQCDRTWQSLRSATRKLVLNADGTPWLFFDLAQDPLEQTNLVDDPARATELRALSSLGKVVPADGGAPSRQKGG